MLVIVPNVLRDAINEKLDLALKECPEAASGREYFYQRLLQYFDEHGILPEFKIVPGPWSEAKYPEKGTEA